MKTLLKSAAIAGLMLTGATGALVPTAVMAQAVVPGIAVANLDAVVANSNAFKTAQQQRPGVYKAQIDQANARQQQLQAQLSPLADKFNKDRAAPNANQAALAQQYQVIQGIQQSGQQELQRILQPVAYSEAYVTEQIEGKLDAAVKSAMTKKNISLLLSPQAVLAANNNAYNINQDILNELNAAMPSATLQPPAGWEPREVREARQQQQGQQQAPQRAAPAAGATQGR
jgi:Skp family chaperone for outer membrane proteins